MNIPTKMFLSYSHQNRRDKDILIEKLAVMIQNREITVWHDDIIIPGEFASQDDILEKLADCDIFLFLLSSASLASNGCKLELKSAVNHNMPIIPILLQSCDWENHEIISRPRILPLNAEPIKSWNIENEAWQNVVDGIRIAVNHHQERRTSTSNSKKNISVEKLLGQGCLFISSNLFDIAIAVYTSILELDPNCAVAYNQRGCTFQMIGEYDRAIADYSKAIEISPDCPIFYNNRGTAYSAKGEYDRAIAEHNKAIEIDPNRAKAYNNLAAAYSAKGEYDRAIAECNTAIRISSDYADAYTNRGCAYDHKGEYNRAIVDHSKAIEINNSRIEINPNHCYGLRQSRTCLQ